MAEHHLVPAAAAPVEELDAAPDAAPVPRRGLVLGGAALAGSAIATLASAEPAAAGHNTNIAYDSQTVVHMDVTNTGVGSTRVSSNVAGTAAFVALNNYPVGISRPDGILGRTSYTTSNCAGVAGACESDTGGIGVMGTAKSATGTGVYAYAGSVVPSTLAPAGTGLYADGPDHGVVAVTQNAGGTALSGTTVDGVAVQGWATGAGMAGAYKAKWWTSQVQNDVLDHCVQLFGGYGYMNEYRVARAWRDARVTKIWAGSNEIMKMLIGRDLGL